MLIEREHDAKRWAGFPITARLGVGDAMVLHSTMSARARALLRPWQRRQYEKGAYLLRADRFYEAEQLGYVLLDVYPQSEEPFTSVYRELIGQRRREFDGFCSQVTRDWHEYAERSFAWYDDYDRALRLASARFARLEPTRQGFLVP